MVFGLPCAASLHDPFMYAVAKPFLLALGLSLALVPLCRWLALRAGRVAHPRADRWHRRPVALLGGVAIGTSLFVGAGVFGLVGQMPVLLACALLMFLTGLVDDLIRLKPATKLIAQIALASALLFFGYRLNWLESTTLDSLLTLVWVVGMTNAFNLLDNMDGLCAGIALIVGAALLIDLLPGATGAAFADVRYLALLLGATGGFLVYNLHPASIFMGDSGSLLIGFSFAAVTLSSGRPAPGRSDVLSIVAAPLLVLLIPIFDTTLVTLSRWFCRAARRRRAAAITRRTAWWPSDCPSAAPSRCSGCSPPSAAGSASRSTGSTRVIRRWLRPSRSSWAWCSSPRTSPASACTTTPTRG